MAQIVRQTTIFGELERELPPGLEELEDFLDVLSEFDEELVRELERERSRIDEDGERRKRGKGRDDLPVRAMWNLLATALFLRNGKQSETLAELQRNSDMARLLGFREIGPNLYRLPSPSALSRFHVKLQGGEDEEANERTRTLFNKTVDALAAENPDFGKDTAFDASDTRSHARPRRVKLSDLSEQEREKYGLDSRQVEDGSESEKKDAESDRVIVSADNDASWSVKTKTVESKDGKKTKKITSSFGFKNYFGVDAKVGGVIGVEVETGSYSDQQKAVPMIRDAQERLPEGRMETVSLDKGFDSEENVLAISQLGIDPIIPFRDVPQNLKDLPSEDREEPLEAGSNIVTDKYTGEVACYDKSGNPEDEAVRRTMTYGGAERDRGAHKFRCPLGGQAEAACPFYASCSAGPAGKQGRQVRISFETDVRRFAPVYPKSKRWKRLYNGRSAVERAFSYAKEVLPLERHALRGKKAIELRALLAAITINVRALMLRRQASSLATAA